MKPKPEHLGPEYGAQFGDESIAAAYATRPPYPHELFDVLESLLPDTRRVVLDLGCGTGDIALGLAGRVERVEAVDPSENMLAVGRARPGADHPSIHWVCASAEQFELNPPYGLMVAGESFHWMDWEVVPGRLLAALHPEGKLALVNGRALTNVPWAAGLAELIPRFTTNLKYQAYDLVDELHSRGLFREEGRHVTRRATCSQSIDDYIESFHTRNGLSRERMTAAAAAEFDRELRSLLLPHSRDGRVEGDTQTSVVWGIPSAG